MVKPIPVPSSNTLRDNEVVGVQLISTSAPSGTVKGLQPTKQKSKVSSVAARAMAALNDDGSSDSDSDEDNIEPTIDFTAVFNELQKYKKKNNGSLSIPKSHSALSNIVDSLSKPSIDIESLANQRWEGNLNKLIEYMNSKKKYPDINTLVSKSTWYKKQPKLVEWVDIQRQQCKLYSQEDDDCVLTKKRAKKLKRLGFDIGKEEKSSKDEVPPSDGKESKKRGKSSQEDTSTRKKIKMEDGALLMKQESTDVEDMVKVEQEDTADDEMKVAADIKETNIKGKCDVCEKKDGFLGHILRRCKCCGVLVHEACYGIPATNGKDRYFTCRACGAMGVDTEVNVPSKIGGTGKKMGKRREKMRQIGRPRECVLCSHDKGTHAMHPLLDVHGKKGRQLVWKGHDGGEKRLAWVHTLCAGLISGNRATASCVYGCGPDRELPNEDPNSEVEYSSEEEFDGSDQEMKPHRSKEKKKLPPSKSEDKNILVKTVANCYYAISNEVGWVEAIEESRAHKCFVCNKSDRKYMIPIGCPAGVKGVNEKTGKRELLEYEEYQTRHDRGPACRKAVHVGCARWGCVEPEGSHLRTIDGGPRYVDKICKLCYFSPGTDRKDKSQTVAHCYCEEHAQDIIINNPDRKRKAN